MAVLALEKLRLQAATDPTDALSAYVSSWSVTKSMPVETRRRAGGRVIAVTRPGAARVAEFGVWATSLDDLGWIEAHLGVLVLARSTRGDRIWGVYAANNYNGFVLPNFPVAVELTLQEVTVSEVV